MSNLLFGCPECGSPAEVSRHFLRTEPAGDGPIGIMCVEIVCLGGHDSMLMDFDILLDYLQAHNYA